MAYADLTPAQRQTLSRLAHIAATETHRAREDFGVHGKDTARIFLGNAYVTIDEVLTALAAALPQTAPDPLKATVNNAQAVTVKNSAGTVTKNGVATVANSAITGVALAATSAIVDNASTATVQNSGGGHVTASATVNVAAGAVSNIRLPATAIGVATGQKVNAGAVTGTGNFATFTVAAGAITGIVLSAS